MPLPKVPITTAQPMYDSAGRPLAGAKVWFKLDRPDYDESLNTVVTESAEECIALDTAGLLPALGPTNMALWANARGRNGSRWLIRVELAGKNIIGPIPCYVKELVNPATSTDLMTLLTLASSTGFLNDQ